MSSQSRKSAAKGVAGSKTKPTTSTKSSARPQSKKKSSRLAQSVPLQPQRLEVYSAPMGKWTTAVTPELSQDNIEQAFFTLFKSSQHSSKPDEQNGVRGLFSTSEISPGDIITAIPSHSAITESLARHSVVGQCVQSILLSSSSDPISSPHKDSFFDEFGGVVLTPGHAILFTYLIFLRFTSAPTHVIATAQLEAYLTMNQTESDRYRKTNTESFQQEESNYHRVYARWLPTEYTIPLCWTHDMMVETGFTHTDMYKSTLSRIKHLEIVYNSIFPQLFQSFPVIFTPEVYTFQRFIWAYCAYTSRSFPAHFLQHFDVVDRLYHLNQQVLYPELYQSSLSLTLKEPTTSELDPSTCYHDLSLCGVMLPYLDLTNHQNGHEIHWLSGPHSNSPMTPSSRTTKSSTTAQPNNTKQQKNKKGTTVAATAGPTESLTTVDQLGKLILNSSTNNNPTLPEIVQSNVHLHEYLVDKITIHNAPTENGIHPTIISPNFTFSFFPPSSTNTTPPSRPQCDLYSSTFYPIDSFESMPISLSSILQLVTTVQLNPNGTCRGDYISYQACLRYRIGDQIHNNYGPKTQDELLFGYGFVLEEFKPTNVAQLPKPKGKKQQSHPITTPHSLLFSPNNAVFVQLPKPALNNSVAQQLLILEHINHVSTTLTNPIQKKLYAQNPFLYELTPHGLPTGMATMMSLFSMTNVDLDSMVRHLDHTTTTTTITTTTTTVPTLNLTAVMPSSLRQRGLLFLLQQLLNKLGAINPLVLTLNQSSSTSVPILEGVVEEFFPTKLEDPFAPHIFPLFSSSLPQLYNQYRLISLYLLSRLVYLCPFAAPHCYHTSLTAISDISRVALLQGLNPTPGTQPDKPPQGWDYPQYCMIIHLITQNHIRFIAIEHTLELLRAIATPPRLLPSPTQNKTGQRPVHPRFALWETTSVPDIICNMAYTSDELWYSNQSPSPQHLNLQNQSSSSSLLCHLPNRYLLSVTNLSKTDLNPQPTEQERVLPPINLVALAIRHYLGTILGGVDFYIESALLLLYIRRMVSEIFTPDGNQSQTVTQYEYELTKAWRMICEDNFNFLPALTGGSPVDRCDTTSTLLHSKAILQPHQYLNASPSGIELFSTCFCPQHYSTTSPGTRNTMCPASFFSTPSFSTTQHQCQNCKQCCKSSPVIGLNSINSEFEIVSMAQDIITKTIKSVQQYFVSPPSTPPISILPHLEKTYPDSSMTLLFGHPAQLTEDLLTAFHLIHQLKVGSGQDLKLVPLPFPLTRQLPVTPNTNATAYSIIQPDGFTIFALQPLTSISDCHITIPLDTPLEAISQQAIAKEDAGIVDSATFFIPPQPNNDLILTSKQRETYNFFSLWAQQYPRFHQQYRDDPDSNLLTLTDFLDSNPLSSPDNYTHHRPQSQSGEEPLILATPRVGDPSDDVLRFDLGEYRRLITQSASQGSKSLSLTVPGSNQPLNIPRISTANTYSLCSKWFVRAFFDLAKPIPSHDDNHSSLSISILPGYITEWFGGYDLETIINTISTSIPCFQQPFISIPVHPNLFTTTLVNSESTIPDQLLLCCLNLLYAAAQAVDGEEEFDFGLDLGNEDGGGDGAATTKLAPSKSTQALLTALLSNQNCAIGEETNHSTDDAYNKCLPKFLNKGDLGQLLDSNQSNPQTLQTIIATHQHMCQIHSSINSAMAANNSELLGMNDVVVDDLRGNFRHLKRIETLRWGAVLRTLLLNRLTCHTTALINLLQQYNTMKEFMFPLSSNSSVALTKSTQDILNDFVTSHLLIASNNTSHELTPAIIYHIVSINSLEVMLNGNTQ